MVSRRLAGAQDKLARERAVHKEEIGTIKAKRSKELDDVRKLNLGVCFEGWPVGRYRCVFGKLWRRRMR